MKRMSPTQVTDVEASLFDNRNLGRPFAMIAMDKIDSKQTGSSSASDSGIGTPSSNASSYQNQDDKGQLVLPNINVKEEWPRWSDQPCTDRCRHMALTLNKLIALVILLYCFICSLGLLGSAFRLIGGKAAGQVFSESRLLRNPIAGLMIGVLGTVLFQSSSTSTSIIVGLVASEILKVQQAIPIVMGANIGTSVTNTIVSVAHSGRREDFRRAFAGATVHDMFNWLCVLILLPLEVFTGYLYHVTGFIVKSVYISDEHKKPPKLIKHLTDPFTNLIVQIDKSKLTDLAIGTNATQTNDEDAPFTLIMRNCPSRTTNITEMPFVQCNNLLALLDLSDTTSGLLLLTTSLTVLVVCLILIVKILNSMLHNKVASTIRKTINNDLPGMFAPLTGYLTIVLGAILTILVQSSSVFTSTLTPLVAIGVLSLERMYPLTLGANVGTTFTSLLAALASPPMHLSNALQVSLCHLFFNLTGIAIFFVVPVMRQVPLGLARILGHKTAKYRWFSCVYVFVMFFFLPVSVFILSLLGLNVLLIVGTPLMCMIVLVTIVNVLQAKIPAILPEFLRNWELLPIWTHSLEPYDSFFMSLLSSVPCFRFNPKPELETDEHCNSTSSTANTTTCMIQSRMTSKVSSPAFRSENTVNSRFC